MLRLVRPVRTLQIAVAAAVLGGTLLSAPASAAEVPSLQRAALVDVQRCIMETNEGRQAKKELESTLAKGQSQLDRKVKALEGRVRDLQAKAAMLSQDELGKRQESIMREQAELEQLSQQLQEEVMQKEALLTEKIYKKVADIVEQMAREEKLQVVLVRSEMTVLYANPKLDLTNRVIVRYDQAGK